MGFWKGVQFVQRYCPATTIVAVFLIGWYYLVQSVAGMYLSGTEELYWFYTYSPSEPHFGPGVVFSSISHHTESHLWVNVVPLLLVGGYVENRIDASPGWLVFGFIAIGVVTINLGELVTSYFDPVVVGSVGASGAVYAVVAYAGSYSVVANMVPGFNGATEYLLPYEEIVGGASFVLLLAMSLSEQLLNPGNLAVYSHLAGAVFGVELALIVSIRRVLKD